MFQAKFLKKPEIFYVQQLFPENYDFYRITWKNIAEPVRSQMKIRRMLVACWIPKATKYIQNM
jgi:hypothetical protein